MIVVHASDLHLDSSLRGLVPYEGVPVEAFRRSSRRAFRNLISLCLDEDARLLVIAGDLVDAAGFDHKTGLFFVKELLRLRETGCQVIFAWGNHDAASRVMRTLLLPEHVVRLSPEAPETRVYEAIGVAVHGQSYPERAVFQNLAASYPEPLSGLVNIGVLHTTAEGSLLHDPYAPVSRRALDARGYDYWALGHVHTRRVLHEAPWVVFPGNLQGRSFLESGPKGATVVRIDGGKVLSVEHRALDVVRFGTCTVNAHSARTLFDLADAAARELALRAERAGARALVVRLLFQGAGDLGGALLRHTPERRLATLRASARTVPGAIWLESVWALFDDDASRRADPAVVAR